MNKEMTDTDYNELISPQVLTALQQILGDDYIKFLQSGCEPFAIRINTLKTDPAAFLQKLDECEIEYSTHPDIPDGLIITGDRNKLTRSLLFFKGEFVVQGLSSQLPVRVLNPQPGEAVLDMAASPGSKSTQIAAKMQNRGKLVLCDPSVRRQQSLLTNLFRAGVMNDVYLQIPGQRAGRLFFEFFDRVLLDAPCSAFSKIPEQISRRGLWRTQVVTENLFNTQYHLLVAAIKAVKPGGIIVYSTCTLTVEENEQLIDRVCREYPLTIEEINCLNGPSVYPGFTEFMGNNFSPELQHTRRILPYPEPFEAFYVAKLRKTAAIPPHTLPILPTRALATGSDPEIQQVLEYLCARWGIEPELFSPYRFLLTNKKIWLITPDWEYAPQEFFVKAGLPLAEHKSPLWKLTTAAVQWLGRAITRSIIYPDDEQMRELFASGRIPWTGTANGYYTLEYKGELLAAASVMQGILKVSLPQTFDV